VIEESETASLKAAEKEHRHLSENVFPDFNIGLLHGRMSADDKEEIMRQFKRGDLHVLVSTTVIEVGVDVPNATVMVIEQAERFGLSQLHQLRGRVGRGGNQSYCLLVTGRLNDTAKERIRTMTDSCDGFHIAEVDLRLRGPGEFFGTKQSGLPSLRIANLLRDQEILELGRKEAVEFLENPPSEAEREKLLVYLKGHWQQRYGLARVG
ncbi:MAG: ATP-dependent DNA helicase RecG, partial [Candidatus Solibacter usitatus]|nr:ATP-dependent DNA helicase RecG [Candidatus Solibacter usitatus]